MFSHAFAMYSLDTLRTSSPSLITSLLLLSCPWAWGSSFSSWFHSSWFSRQKLWRTAQATGISLANEILLSSHFSSIHQCFLASQKLTLQSPWHPTKLYWKLFPLDLSLLQEMVFEAKRQVGMRCLHLDGVWYHYPQFTQNHLSESDRALQDQIFYYFVELSHHAYCLESQMQSQGSVSCHRQ